MGANLFNWRNLQLVNHVLTDFVHNLRYPNGMIGNQIVFSKSVSKDNGKFRVLKADGLYELGQQIAKGAWADANTAGYSSTTYSCEEFGAGWFVVKDEMEEADDTLNIYQDQVMLANERVDRRFEERVFAAIKTTSAVKSTKTLTSGVVWINSTSVNSSSDFKGDIAWAKRVIKSATKQSLEANTIIIPSKVADYLWMHPDIYDFQKYVNPNIMDIHSMPSKIFGLNVLVANSVYITDATNKKGTSTVTQCLTDKAIVCHLSSKYPWVVAFKRRNKRFMIRDDNPKVITGEVNQAFDIKVLNTDLAAMIVNIEA